MTSTETDASELTIIKVDPRTLGVLDQARADATPDDELIASVRQHGIMQPPTVAFDDEQGRYVIIMGHRRVGAAIAAGYPLIPAIVRPDWVDHEALKLEQQIVENERRKGLTSAELAAGYQQLELFGRTPEDIAAALGETTDRINAGLKVSRAKKVPELLEQHPEIDLATAAALAEFDDDKGALTKLTEIALTRPEYFEDHLRRQRRKRKSREQADTLRDQLAAEGVTIIKAGNSGGDWWRGDDRKGGTLNSGLFTETGKEITPAKHKKCPGHAAIVSDGGEWGDSRILYVCTDVEGNGHGRGRNAAAITPEELERRQQAEEARARKTANTAARREWIREHLAAGRLRPTAQHFEAIAEALSVSAGRGYDANIATVELLTGETLDQWHTAAARITKIVETNELPALRVIVAHALAVLDQPWVGDMLHCRHLERLASWGYQLTEIDQATLDDNLTAPVTETAADATDDGDPREDYTDQDKA